MHGQGHVRGVPRQLVLLRRCYVFALNLAFHLVLQLKGGTATVVVPAWLGLQRCNNQQFPTRQHNMRVDGEDAA